MSCIHTEDRSYRQPERVLVLQICGFSFKGGKGAGGGRLQVARKNCMKHIRALLHWLIGAAAVVFIILSIFFDVPDSYLTIGLALNLIFLLGGVSKRKKTPEIFKEQATDNN